jgi:hypothetical protein
MGGAYSAYGVKMLTGFGGGNVKDRHQFEDLRLCGRIILKCIFKKLDGWVCTGLSG